MTKMKIVGCHELGIRKDPSETDYSSEVIEVVKADSILEVDTEDTNWSWDGYEFYRVKTPTGKWGWAITSALKPV